MNLREPRLYLHLIPLNDLARVYLTVLYLFQTNRYLSLQREAKGNNIINKLINSLDFGQMVPVFSTPKHSRGTWHLTDTETFDKKKE